MQEVHTARRERARPSAVDELAEASPIEMQSRPKTSCFELVFHRELGVD